MLVVEHIEVEVAPAFRHALTHHDLIKADIFLAWAGAAEEALDLEPGVVGIFEVYVENSYHLRAAFKNGVLFFIRNGHRAVLDLRHIRSGEVMLSFRWSPTLIQVSYSSEKHGQKSVGIETPYVLPPNSLLDWAREQSILPSRTYASNEVLGREVVSALQTVARKVETVGPPHGFWDYVYGPHGRIEARNPKKERNAQPTLELLLYDIGTAKNINFSAETNAGSGSLDFLATGVLADGKLANVAIEVKNAHSQNLMHGLTHQLPAYMKAKQTDVGVYCVLWYKGRHFQEPSGYSLNGDLGIKLQGELNRLGLAPSIRVLIIDLSIPTGPSTTGEAASPTK